MNNFEEVNAETLSQVNNNLGSQDNAIASRKLGSGKQSMQGGVRQSSQTDLTSGTKEGCGSPDAKSDKGSSNSPSQRSNKKRKIDEISNENAQTEAAASCGDSVGQAEQAGSVQQSRKRMKMNDGEARSSPAKSPKAT